MSQGFAVRWMVQKMAARTAQKIEVGMPPGLRHAYRGKMGAVENDGLAAIDDVVELPAPRADAWDVGAPGEVAGRADEGGSISASADLVLVSDGGGFRILPLIQLGIDRGVDQAPLRRWPVGGPDGSDHAQQGECGEEESKRE
jgi:hypothetical protein